MLKVTACIGYGCGNWLVLVCLPWFVVMLYRVYVYIGIIIVIISSHYNRTFV
jgi:hypothetical protein